VPPDKYTKSILHEHTYNAGFRWGDSTTLTVQLAGISAIPMTVLFGYSVSGFMATMSRNTEHWDAVVKSARRDGFSVYFRLD